MRTRVSRDPFAVEDGRDTAGASWSRAMDAHRAKGGRGGALCAAVRGSSHSRFRSLAGRSSLDPAWRMVDTGFAHSVARRGSDGVSSSHVAWRCDYLGWCIPRTRRAPPSLHPEGHSPDFDASYLASRSSAFFCEAPKTKSKYQFLPCFEITTYCGRIDGPRVVRGCKLTRFFLIAASAAIRWSHHFATVSRTDLIQDV